MLKSNLLAAVSLAAAGSAFAADCALREPVMRLLPAGSVVAEGKNVISGET